MLFNNSFIQSFLDDKELQEEPLFKLLEDFKEPDIKRKDVVKEVSTQIQAISDKFPIFNSDLWNSLFIDTSFLDTISICPMVGGNKIGYQIHKDDKIYLFIDVIQVANCTRVVSQMMYIIKNFISLEVTKIGIHQYYPMKLKEYLDILDYLTFANGLANFLAWNEDCNTYSFHTDKYEVHKEKAFGMLAQAIEVDNKVVQHKLLLCAKSPILWDRFASVAGMFYIHDIYQEQGTEGIVSLFNEGPNNFIYRIFHS
ncbi:MAG: hypothetical protein RR766_01920 [Longicatena sp.]